MSVIAVLDMLVRCDSSNFQKGVSGSIADLNRLGGKLGATKVQVSQFTQSLQSGGIKSSLFDTPEQKFDNFTKRMKFTKGELEAITSSMKKAGLSQAQALPMLEKVFAGRQVPQGNIFSSLSSGAMGLVGKLLPLAAAFLSVGEADPVFCTT